MNYRILELESSQLFAKQANKTQILITNSIQTDIYRTRQTHSYEVRTISEIIAKKIGFDKAEELAYISMTHDIGHPPFGHRGAEILNDLFKKKGLQEGFSDNNNNLRMIEHNELSANDYELVSLIKYPKKLYPDQKKKYLYLLNRIVDTERKYWGKKLKRTVACNIMDIADEIAYTTSDLYDSFSTGYTKDILSIYFSKLVNKYKSEPKLFSILNSIVKAAESDYKRVLRNDIFNLKMILIENLYWNFDNANLEFKSILYKKLMKDIFSFTYKYFINNKSIELKKVKASNKLLKLTNHFLDKGPDSFPSDMYRYKYIVAKNEEDRLRIVRDMISDTTDIFVLNYKIKG